MPENLYQQKYVRKDRNKENHDEKFTDYQRKKDFLNMMRNDQAYNN